MTSQYFVHVCDKFKKDKMRRAGSTHGWFYWPSFFETTVRVLSDFKSVL
jgi:hypothetical protein